MFSISMDRGENKPSVQSETFRKGTSQISADAQKEVVRSRHLCAPVATLRRETLLGSWAG